MRLRRRLQSVAVAAAVVVLGGLFVRHRVRAQWDGPVSSLEVTLARPDALIQTHSLSALPKDLLQVPLLRDLLTEDFVFFYEEHPDRLGLRGTLRRIAYEHDLSWKDEILSWALDQPAEIALWRGPAGSLDHWMITLTRRELAGLLQEAATVAASDRQLKIAGRLTVGEAETTVYALERGTRRTLLLASRGDRVVVLSDPGLLFGEDRALLADSQRVVAALLSGNPTQHDLLRGTFTLETAPEAQHTVSVRTHWLSFGYQRFFPGLLALRFDFGRDGWATRALLDGSALPASALADRELWASVPANPALCALLPVDWSQGSSLAEGAPATVARSIEALSSELSGPAAVCWYPEGRLQTPLVVALLKSGRPALAPRLGALFNWAIRRPAGGALAVGRREAGGLVFSRELEVPFAAAGDPAPPEPGPLTITLAVAGRHVFFSPDAERVAQALDTVAHRYPALADTLPAEGVTLGLLVPRALSALSRKEALVMLPRADEPVFRTAAERHLLPRLSTVERYPAYRLTLAAAPGPGPSWRDVAWQEVHP
jgi:uncharacterized protein YfaA (DUF2138 family)